LINGILVINKRSGLTSHQTVKIIRKIYPGTKVGHSGTLDPMATGVLPVCLGKATRLVEYIIELPKHYRASITLGRSTDTGDAEGSIIKEMPVPMLSEKQIGEIIDSFRGIKEQHPPLYSAVKYKGRPLYKWTREGINVPQKSKKVAIYRINIERYQINHEPHLIIDLECSRGTYVRTLACDIGNLIGCGAHLSALSRLAVGPYRIESSFTIDNIVQMGEKDHHLQAVLPMDSALKQMPKINLSDYQLESLKRGQEIEIVDGDEMPELMPEVLYRLYDSSNLFKALGLLRNEGNTFILKTVKYLDT
jgi:tRNA pseudouridine55 synthase